MSIPTAPSVPIPPEWRTRNLLELVSIATGQVDPREPRYRDLTLVAPDHVEPETGRLLARVSARAQGAVSGKYRVRPGDVVYSKIRPYLKKAVLCDFEGLCSADMYPLTPKPGVSGSFVLHTLLSEPFTSFATSVSARSGIPKINRTELAEYRVLTPGPQEQAAIAATLDDTDRLVAALERAVAKRQAVKHGMLQQLLSGMVRLSGFDGPWAERPLGEIARITMGQSPPSASYNTSRRGLPLLQGNADIKARRSIERLWTTAPAKTCARGDVLLTVRAPVGLASMASRDACLGRGVCALDSYGSNDYLFHALVLAEPRWAAYEQGSTFTAINSEEIRNFPITLPDDVAEQAAIAGALDDVDANIRTLRERLAKAKAIKQGMMQELLTGRTQLPVGRLEAA